MRTTIDGAGRIVIPKAIRDRLGLTGGREVDLAEVDGTIVIEPAPTAVKLVKRGRRLVAEPQTAVPRLTHEVVRETIEKIRR